MKNNKPLTKSRQIIQNSIIENGLTNENIADSLIGERGDIRESLKQSLIEMRQIRSGKLPCKTWRELKAMEDKRLDD